MLLCAARLTLTQLTTSTLPSTLPSTGQKRQDEHFEQFYAQYDDEETGALDDETDGIEGAQDIGWCCRSKWMHPPPN